MTHKATPPATPSEVDALGPAVALPWTAPPPEAVPSQLPSLPGLPRAGAALGQTTSSAAPARPCSPSSPAPFAPAAVLLPVAASSTVLRFLAAS